ncbi:MAG: SDR family NAD(P)-dependent oxidoreductase [Hyphomonadaceae bacterium]
MPSEQKPIGSGFTRDTTAEQALGRPDMRGVNVVITGASAGIGVETARVLANAGATVIAAVRAPERARAALNGLPNVEIETLELSDPASIDAFAEGFLASARPLHLLINNAGVMAIPQARDGRGNELQFSTNHLGHFQLTARLWPALKRAQGARVVALSSGAHRRSPVVFEDVNYTRRAYDKWQAYGQSKTANSLFAVELDARGEKDGVRAFAVHPGVIPGTELQRSLTAEDRAGVTAIGGAKTVPQGAATTVWCATAPQLAGKGGVYCEDVEIAEAAAADKASPGGVRPWAIDRGAARQLWALSETMTGVQLP